VVVRNDGEHYGQFLEYRFPRQSLVFGPQQVVNRINQDTEISRQLALWDQRGSSVIRGELMVIPIEEALIYVQPIFLRAEGGRIPEMRRVVVAYENQVVMEETLEEGLARIFGGAVAGPTPAAAAAPRRRCGSPGGGREAPDRPRERPPRPPPRRGWPRARASTTTARSGPARRRLGALRRGDPPARRGAPADGEPPSSTRSSARHPDVPRRRSADARRGPRRR
jgi:uncharacterized membrane protein (UPF0182 family)